jgi:PEGA domain
MRSNALVFAFVVAMLSRPSAAQNSGTPTQPLASNLPVQVVLTDGTPVKLRLGSTAASSGARVGENLELEVAEDVRLSDVVVVVKGSIASAEVTGLHAGVVNSGRIDVNLRSISLSDGQIIPVRATREQPNRDSQALIVSSASQDASFAPGTTVTAYVSGNQQLDLTRLRAASGPTQAMKITSTPPHAEVLVDGHLSGSTPYLFHVSAGDHIVLVRMAGFQPWQRTVHVAGDAVNLEAALAKQDGTEAMPASKAPEASLGDLARAARARKAQSGADSGGQAVSGAQANRRDSTDSLAPQQ